MKQFRHMENIGVLCKTMENTISPLTRKRKLTFVVFYLLEMEYIEMPKKNTNSLT